MSVSVIDLGRRQYPEVWAMQKELVQERSSGLVPDTLLLVEHEHVVTLGRKTSKDNLERELDIPVFQVERGGDATYHGPGQLVGYPITRMDPPDVRKFVRNLEEVLILTVGNFSIPAVRIENHSGVWVEGRKVASIGVAVTNWVTYHGFALNVNTDLSYFRTIRPCGLDPDTITSMEKLIGRPVDMLEVKRALVKNFATVFGVTMTQAARPSPGSVIAARGKD